MPDETEAEDFSQILLSAQETLQHTKALVTRLEPKLDAAATDMSEITRMAREETARISASWPTRSRTGSGARLSAWSTSRTTLWTAWRRQVTFSTAP